MHDVVVRGGLLVDGTGRPAGRADLAIDGERISAIAPAIPEGRRVIDATGCWVTPGFIDPHTHLLSLIHI